MTSLPLDPEDCPGTPEYEDERREREERRSQRMIDEYEERRYGLFTLERGDIITP